MGDDRLPTLRRAPYRTVRVRAAVRLSDMRGVAASGGEAMNPAYQRVHRLFVRWGLVKHPFGREYVREHYGLFGGER